MVVVKRMEGSQVRLRKVWRFLKAEDRKNVVESPEGTRLARLPRVQGPSRKDRFEDLH